VWKYFQHFFIIMLTSAEQHRISALLHRLGCNEREAEIYLLCLTIDPSSVQEIARLAGANRFTIHSAVEQLIQKGLLCETRKGKRRLISAESPDVLFRIIARRGEELEKLQLNAEYAVKMLTSLLPVSQGKPKVRFYEGIDGYKKMLEETLSARGEVLVFSYVPMLASLVGENNLESYFRKRGRKGINTRLIFPPCAFADRVEERSKEYRIRIRFLPKGMEWTSGIFCWNDCVSFLSYTQNRLTSTIIENKDIAGFFRSIIFELCWSQASEKAR